VRCDDDLKELDAPVRALKQAMGVLLRNAFDASPADRPVTLGIHRTRAGRVIFEVEDQGCGMNEEVLRRAGQPFFTTKSPGKGMGLGLFLVRLVAQRYGGSFSLNSRPGEGTRSALELPAATAGLRT
jgi:two-component system sensor histidine kinase RegB